MVEDHDDIATMSASRSEEEEGKMGPRPVEQQEKMVGNNNVVLGADGKHDDYITQIDGNMVIT